MKKLVIDFRMNKSSGIGRYITNIVPFLISQFKISLIVNKNDSLEGFDFVKDTELIFSNSKIYSIKEQLELPFIIPECDIFWSPHYNIPILPIKAKKRAVTIHDVYHLAFFNTLSFAQKIYAKIIFNFAVRLSSYIFTDSVFSKKEIYKYINTNKNIDVIYCGIKHDICVDATLENFDFKYILYVGNIKPHKNIKRAIEAFNMLPKCHNDIKFIIVGEKENFITGDADLIKFSNENIIFTGKIDDVKLNTLYQNALALVFVSLYEGFGLPPLEAMASGCPVLASKCASIPEVCQDGALYCDAYSIDDIVLKLETILTDETLRDTLIEKGFQNIKRFNWNNSAMQIRDIFNNDN